MRWIKKLLLLLVTLVFIVSLYGVFKPIEGGISMEGEIHKDSGVEFIYDLTYEEDEMVVHQQNIFNKVFQIINDAENFIIVDMFLFNDNYDRQYEYPELSATLTKTLIDKKKNNPDINVTFLTDEINECYGAYSNKYLEKLKDNGIEVVVTDLNALRDSNPIYSGVWNIFIKRFGTEGKGWLPNVFDKEGEKVTARSYLKLLNFKANHRKVLITEKKALITSANPHDASAYHSNIAFVVEGDILQDLLVSEKAVAGLGVEEPGYEAIPVSAGDISVPKNMVLGTSNIDNMEICLLTEGKIKQHLLQEIKKTSKDDVIKIGMFYLSERDVIKELIKASGRGVEINLILDANKDAFGMEKNGIPNRPVAEELYKESGEKINIKWYKTHGEQYHTKLILIRGREKSVVFGGSANLTRRNIGDYNLETDLKITANNSSKVIEDVEQYFRRVWNNTEGIYTVDFEEYREQSFWKRILYLFQEWSGLSTV